MNSSLEPPRTVVFALCGSFCTFETVLPQIIRLRACGWEVLPMLSYAASALDTRFGRAADWKQRLEEATGHRPLEDLREAEPLGPKHMAQALVIAPCTGTTMALLAAGISATPVTLAAKSMLRGGRPVVIGVSTNDGLSGSVGALAALLQRKNYYFIPFGQDDSYKKPCSLKADFTQLPDTLEAQAHASMKNLGAILKEAGASYGDIVKTTIFLQDMNDFGKVNEIYKSYFTDGFPARSCVEIGKLPLGGLVEVECVAVIDD